MILLVIHDLDGNICRKQVPQGGLYIFHKQIPDITGLKIVGAMQIKSTVTKVYGFQLIKPCFDGGFRKFTLQLNQNIVPDICYGVQKTPLLE
jgi:hypothetical protein